jgi:hypothetical protein
MRNSAPASESADNISAKSRFIDEPFFEHPGLQRKLPHHGHAFAGGHPERVVRTNLVLETNSTNRTECLMTRCTVTNPDEGGTGVLWSPMERSAIAVLLLVLCSSVLLATGQRRARLPRPNAVAVSTTTEFRAALGAATPGTVIAVNPGTYSGGSYHANVHGTAAAPIVIQAADPARPPVFVGGYNGIQLSDASYVTFRDLIFEGASQNGINVDDASTFETPSHHIVLRRVTVRNLAGTGNRDGIKLSGVTDFVIEEANMSMWGEGGSAVDMVGCHRGVVLASVFRHVPGLTGGTGIQAKGGSSQITITGNRFEHATARAVQIGGTTSLSLFRPQPNGAAEAREILVERNIFVGSQTPVAFVGSDGGIFRFNTVYLPTSWPLRILQENRSPGLVRSRNGVYTDNIVYWSGSQVVNIGRNTEPSSFTFARNWWYRADASSQSHIALPSPESGGVYGRDPEFVAAAADFHTLRDLPAGAYGN